MNMLALMKLLHYIGIAWGAGGATIATILTIKAEKDPQIAPLVGKVMPPISKLIWASLILLAVSGIGLKNLVYWPIDSNILTIKLTLVTILVINGINMTVRILPKIEKLAPKGGAPSGELLKMKKQVKIAGMIGLTLWYLIIILSVIM